MEEEKHPEKEYEDELRDKLEILVSRDSPNLSSSRRMRWLAQSNENSSSEPKALEDLPVLELEGAPAGWSRGGRRRQTLGVPEPAAPGHRGSILPVTGGKENDRRKSSSARNSRRASQMTFDEWCQLKKFQELHTAAINSQDQKSEDGHRNVIKRNISYEEWCNASKERKRQQMKLLEDYKKKEEEAKIAQDQAKFKRSLSFDKWVTLKQKAKAAAAKVKEANSGEEKEGSRRNSVEKGQDSDLTPEERKKKAEEAHRRWMIKKEMEEIKKERDKLLKMQNAKLLIADPDNNPVKGQSRRRGSWIETNGAIQVAANRNRKDS